MTDSLETQIIVEAQKGNSKALETLVRHIQDRVHHLAIRMLVDPEQAMDAAQEILIRVVTKLSTFKFQSTFETWVYSVATNYLLTARKAASKHAGLTFDLFAADLENGLVDETVRAPEDHIMLNELRINCTMAMLLCLDKEHRIAYILGDILEFDQAEATAALGISKDNYRKRLSRARSGVIAFTAKSCGLASQAAKCSCPRRLPQAVATGRIAQNPDPHRQDAPAYAQIRDQAARTQADLVATKLQRATGALRSPTDVAAQITRILQT